MKNKMTKFAVAIIAVLGWFACDNENDNVENEMLNDLPLVEVTTDGYTNVLTSNLKTVLASETTSPLSGEEEGLLLMREEELLAHDVYSLFGDLYALKIFSNITSSEATHAQAMLDLLNLFGLEDPATGVAGTYTNETLQSLYTELTEKGKVSVEEALQVGAYIEEVDIKDLEDLMGETENEEILLVYDNLQRGSRNHLRAFVKVLKSYGIVYVPSVLTQEDFDAIITSDIEKGNGSRNSYRYQHGNRGN